MVTAKPQEQELLKMLWESQEWSSGAQGRMGVEVTWFRHERENEMGHVGGL